MGKSNRIRAKHAEKKIVTPVKVKAKQKKAMPLWLSSAIAGIVALAVLFVCVMGVISSNGVIKRNNKALYTENFKISENMLSYIFQNQYANFTSSYSSQLASIGFDTTKSLKDQAYDETSTWYDYFVNSSIEEASQILLFCEEAYARGKNNYYDTHDTKGYSKEELVISDEVLTQAIIPLLEEKFALGMFENPYRDPKTANEVVIILALEGSKLPVLPGGAKCITQSSEA